MAKGGKKGAKKPKKGSASGTPGLAGGEELDELSKQFYIVQIRDLEEKLGRYQQKCDLLTLQNQEFQQKYQNEQLEKEDITAYLRKQMEQKQDMILELKEEILTVQSKADKEKQDAMNRYTNLKHDTTEQIDRLRAESALLQGSLTSLQDFKVRKDELEAQYRDLQATLDQVNTQHNDKIYQLERKQVIDKDRLKREMVGRVNAVATEFRRVSNQQMAETTKRTIQENVAVNSQLVKLTDKTKDLMSENESLRAKLQEQNRKLEMLEKTERELSRKNHCSARLISLLTERSNELETDLGVTEEVLEETRNTVDALESHGSTQMGLKDQHDALKNTYDDLENRHEETVAEYTSKADEVTRLKRVIDECSSALTNHLMGVGNTTTLPNILPVLMTEASAPVKKAVQEQLGSVDTPYETGLLGLVQKD